MFFYVSYIFNSAIELVRSEHLLVLLFRILAFTVTCREAPVTLRILGKSEKNTRNNFEGVGGRW